MSANVIRTTRLPARLAPTTTAVAVTVAAAVVLLVLFYTVGGPFGTVNDLANAVVGLLSAVLAVQTARLGVPAAAVATAGVGGALMVAGSWLVITDRSGWVLAGLVSALGAAALGAWLVVLNLAARRAGTLGTPVARLGTISGALMTLGVLTVPDLLALADAWKDLHWYGVVGFLGWLGLYLGYPVWCALVACAAGQRRTG
jgi:hypothetical protein